MEILETLKVFLDCKNCVFVLAIDYQVVNMGVEQKYGDLFKDKEKSRKFFDKIIQVPFKMPVAHYKIDKYVEKTLSDMNFSTNKVGGYIKLITDSIGCNPRGMKRIFNAFLLLSYIYPNVDSEQDETNQLMLFASLCLQLSFEEVYNYIVANENETVNAEWFNGILNDEEPLDFLETLKETLEEDQPNYYVKASTYLKSFAAVISDGKKNVTEDQVKKLFECLKIASTTASISTSTVAVQTTSRKRLENVMAVIEHVRRNKDQDLNKTTTEAIKAVGYEHGKKNGSKKTGNYQSTVSSDCIRGLKLGTKQNFIGEIKTLFDTFDSGGDFTKCELYKIIVKEAAKGESLEKQFNAIKEM